MCDAAPTVKESMSKATLDTTPGHFALDAVEALAAEMQAGDPDWAYTPNYDPSGRSPWARIEIRDEDGEFVAFATRN